MVDYRRPNNCVNYKTVIFFIEDIFLHSWKTLFTFSSCRERVIRIDSIARPKYSIVCTVSMNDLFTLVTNPKLKCWKIKVLIFRWRKSDIGTFKSLIKLQGGGPRWKHRYRRFYRFPSHRDLTKWRLFV